MGDRAVGAVDPPSGIDPQGKDQPEAQRAERAAWVAWAQVTGVGPVLLGRLERQFGRLAVAWQADDRALGEVEGVGPQTLANINQTRDRLDPAQELLRHEAKNPQFWTPAEADYPVLLREMADPPPLLYWRGQPQAGDLDGTRPWAAMVGTRGPSDYGRRWTRRLATALVRQGWGVVSGLADGIDAEGHQAAIAAGGRTIAVLGTGVDRVYPSRNRDLYGEIVGTGNLPGAGLALSEYPAGTPPDRSHFPRRNRIVAALSRATLVIEGNLQSGAMITARLAADYGREVFALPGSLDNPQAIGCLALLRDGATVILGEEELLAALAALPGLDLGTSASSLSPGASLGESSRLGTTVRTEPSRRSATQDRPIAPLVPAAVARPAAPAHLAPILAAVEYEPTPFDRLVTVTGCSPAEVSVALIELELLGWVAQLPGMHYQRS